MHVNCFGRSKALEKCYTAVVLNGGAAAFFPTFFHSSTPRYSRSFLFSPMALQIPLWPPAALSPSFPPARFFWLCITRGYTVPSQGHLPFSAGSQKGGNRGQILLPRGGGERPSLPPSRGSWMLLRKVSPVQSLTAVRTQQKSKPCVFATKGRGKRGCGINFLCCKRKWRLHKPPLVFLVHFCGLCCACG